MKIKKFRFSIFIKLTILFIFFTFASILVISFSSRFNNEMRPKRLVPPFIKQMNEYIIKDVGFPPDTMKAKKFADELNTNIRYKFNDFEWTTSELVPNIEELSNSKEFQHHFPSHESFMMRFKDKEVFIKKVENGVIILLPPTPKDFFNPEKIILLFISLFIIILVPLYFLLRWLFNPLKKITSTIKQIGDGNYDVKIPIKRNDELGELSSSINNMSESIKNSHYAKEQLLIDVSHELRTPITRIKLALELDSSKEQINEDLNEIQQKINSILENYRAESKHLKLDFIKTDFIQFVDSTINEYLNKSRLKFTYPENLKNNLYVNLDINKFRTVLRNLFDNALKYSSNQIDIFLNVETDFIELHIKDTGIGISEKDLKYIFEPFYRSDSSRSKKTGGFGLGLAIAKKILDAHKCEIFVKSELNKGTEVIVKILK